MKVGIFFGNSSPFMGGGYTFENEFFKSLGKYSDKSNHSFILIYDNELPEPIRVSKIKKISIQSVLNQNFKSSKTNIFSRNINKITKRIKLRKNQVKESNDKLIQKLLVDNEIEFILYLRQWDCLTNEIPYIIVVWDLQHRFQPYFPEVSNNGEWEKREKRYKFLLRRAAGIITGTKVGKSDIEFFYQVAKNRVKVIPFPTPNFVFNETPDTAKQILKEHGIPKEYLFYPAQFWPHKNHIGILKAISLLRDVYNEIYSVVFVGTDKGNLDYVKRQVKELGLLNQVFFLDYVSRKDLVSLYQNAFALAFLTFFGPDNLPPLEAFALGCPVIASNVPGSKEQLGDSALMVDPKNIEHIAKMIKLLKDNPELRLDLIKRGKKRASQWKGEDYVKEVFVFLDEFDAIRKCWSNNEIYKSIKLAR